MQWIRIWGGAIVLLIRHHNPPQETITKLLQLRPAGTVWPLTLSTLTKLEENLFELRVASFFFGPKVPWKAVARVSLLVFTHPRPKTYYYRGCGKILRASLTCLCISLLLKLWNLMSWGMALNQDSKMAECFWGINGVFTEDRNLNFYMIETSQGEILPPFILRFICLVPLPLQTPCSCS